MPASLNSQHSPRNAVGPSAFKLQHNLLCSFSLFVENRLSLSSIATLLPVTTPLSLHIQRTLAFFVLCYFVGLVLPTPMASPAVFRNSHHVCEHSISMKKLYFSFLIYILNIKLLRIELLSKVLPIVLYIELFALERDKIAVR